MKKKRTGSAQTSEFFEREEKFPKGAAAARSPPRSKESESQAEVTRSSPEGA